ncbi:hypothetical protein, partial [Paenibacillus aceti]|uniref:hypothetical protein n=1 Tax=Paenibacillus aceti TaxID=1820010 RepID=UPI001E541CC2
ETRSLVVQFSKINFVFSVAFVLSSNFYNISYAVSKCKTFFENLFRKQPVSLATAFINIPHIARNCNP